MFREEVHKLKEVINQLILNNKIVIMSPIQNGYIVMGILSMKTKEKLCQDIQSLD